MNKKNLNCHPEDIEGSQPLHISTRNIAENTKLNREIAEELKKHISLSCQCSTLASRSNKDSLAIWILRSSRSMTMIFCLTIFILFPTLAKAEQCTPTPDCASLGYTETSCPDGGGVKCPWNTNLMYCPKCETKNPCLSCYVGWILNSDMTCSTEKENGKTPIGVVVSQIITGNNTDAKCGGTALALSDLSQNAITWENANSQSNVYSTNGINGWRLPLKEELSAIYENIANIQATLIKSGGTKLNSNWYWSSSVYNNDLSKYWIINLSNGKSDKDWKSYNSNYYARPVLKF